MTYKFKRIKVVNFVHLRNLLPCNQIYQLIYWIAASTPRHFDKLSAPSLEISISSEKHQNLSGNHTQEHLHRIDRGVSD